MTDRQIKQLSDIQLLELYKSKALVCLCKEQQCNCGPQKIAQKTLKEIKLRKINLPEHSLALSEDSSCGRRKHSNSKCEFDEIMSEFIGGLKSSRIS